MTNATLGLRTCLPDLSVEKHIPAVLFQSCAACAKAPGRRQGQVERVSSFRESRFAIGGPKLEGQALKNESSASVMVVVVIPVVAVALVMWRQVKGGPTPPDQEFAV